MATWLQLIFFSVSPAQSLKNGCKSVSDNQITFWGKQNIILKEAAAFKSVRGKVIGATKALAGVLIEIYDNPDGLLMAPSEREARKAKQTRIEACVTGSKGEFYFPNLRPGAYEFRFSKAAEWDSTSIYLVVNPNDKHRAKKKACCSNED